MATEEVPMDSAHPLPETGSTAVSDHPLSESYSSRKGRLVSVFTGTLLVLLVAGTIPIMTESFRVGNVPGDWFFRYMCFYWTDALVLLAGVLTIVSGLKVTKPMLKCQTLTSLTIGLFAPLIQLFVALLGVLIDGTKSDSTAETPTDDGDEQWNELKKRLANDADPMLSRILLVMAALKTVVCCVAFAIHHDVLSSKKRVRYLVKLVEGPLPDTYHQWVGYRGAVLGVSLLRLGLTGGTVYLCVEMILQGSRLSTWYNQILGFWWPDLCVAISGIFGMFSVYKVSTKLCSYHSRLSYAMTFFPVLQAMFAVTIIAGLGKNAENHKKSDATTDTPALDYTFIVFACLKIPLCLAGGWLHTKSWKKVKNPAYQNPEDPKPVTENPENIPLAPPPNYEDAVTKNDTFA